ncbi:MAG: hypothetical protein AAB019_00860 [Planctomycetota bacterium]
MANKIIPVLILSALIGLFSSAFIRAEETKSECDLKTMEEAYWCDSCVEAAENVISGYICSTCPTKTDKSEITTDRSGQAGQCPDCKKDLIPAKRHQDCGNVISDKKNQVCVKTGYICENDDAESFQPGECFNCEEEMEKITVKSLVVYLCKECSYIQREAGNCRRNKDLSCYDKPLNKTCENSGLFPHVPVKSEQE